MKGTKIKYTFVNPNTSEDTLQAVQKIIIENIIRKDETAMKPRTKSIPA